MQVYQTLTLKIINHLFFQNNEQANKKMEIFMDFQKTIYYFFKKSINFFILFINNFFQKLNTYF